MFARIFTLFFAAGCISSLAQSLPGKTSDTAVPAAPSADTPKPLSPETRGDIFMARKMYREAIETFREGSPKDPVIWNKTGIAYHQLMQLDQARKCYEQAIKLKPNYMEALNNLGTVYYAKKSPRRAISWYNRALKIAPSAPTST